MNYNEKTDIVSKYAIKKQQEANIIQNASIDLPFGEDIIKIKELPWTDAEKFEIKVVEIFGYIQDSLGSEVDTEDMIKNVKSKGIKEFLEIVVLKVMNKDLLELVEILTRGKVNLEYIVDKEATKNQIIQIAVEGMKLNYSYLKNLMSLAQSLFRSKQ